MVIVIIGILAGIATMKLTATLDTARYESTMAEMERLAEAIVGNPETYAAGAQADFGYIGDVGALPPNLDALAVNPGYMTWDGPYVSVNFTGDDYKKDAWNVDYIYGGVFLRSIGSGSTIDKIIASSAAQLLACAIQGYLLDANNTAPGTAFADSVSILLVYPDGTGGITTAFSPSGPDGAFSFTGVPVGNHTLRVIYVPESDTVDYQISIIPGHDAYITANLPADLW